MCWTLFAQSRATHQRSGKKEHNNFPNTWGIVICLFKIKDIKIPYTLIAQLRFLPRVVNTRVVNSRFVSCTMVCEDSGTFKYNGL